MTIIQLQMKLMCVQLKRSSLKDLNINAKYNDFVHLDKYKEYLNVHRSKSLG